MCMRLCTCVTFWKTVYLYMLRSRFDSTGLNIAASQKIEFWRGLHNFNQTFILGNRDVSINCKSALPGIHKALGSKARMGAIVGNFKAFFLESTWMIFCPVGLCCWFYDHMNESFHSQAIRARMTAYCRVGIKADLGYLMTFFQRAIPRKLSVNKINNIIKHGEVI